MKLFRVMVMAAILALAVCAAPHVTWAGGVNVGVAIGIPAPVIAYPAPVYYAPPAYYPPPAVYGPAVVVAPRYGYGYGGPHYRHWHPGYRNGHYYRHYR